jgi:anti-sigma regulatory factor (Ser/Thr protein kinase)
MTANGDLTPHAGGHIVEFYDDDFELVVAVTDFILPALRADGVAILVATPAHNRSFEAALRMSGVDTSEARAQGRLIFAGAAETLAQFCTGSQLDPAGFDITIGGLVAAVSQPGRELRIYGEMVGLLWDDGEVAAAMELEAMWNALQQRRAFSLLCGYRADPNGDDELPADLTRVACLHTEVWDAHVQRTETRSFGADIAAPRLARRFVADTLRAWEFDELLDDALLVVSELATNAILHGRADFTVRVHQAGQRVRIGVYDTADSAPVQIEAPALAVNGRGLALVASVSDQWGCDRARDGKTVWADLPAVATS